ncbi:phosphopyruvate hydratase [Candidatus Curtissbacteria bacterium RIFCSPHIGHO2_01_FULL_41_44]|uniref:Enolase n=1 Tax=Candidatus Curtissbacteria bacterium RIFCSPLOWO2_01_FULL_42_50 TaxID=1797730 RepID=A0A1F5H4B0_9BACT|nr:MAG: phosphopyruvate hydratase [Candidatus Curtissbacteria bacterium RIFCSPHIGHO2_01_FULL_41_44]OGD93237.1 MAG: phosphopyruvate hydratase [Candidatus Curtissbacteria bacterium RIFCSPHIGHO2_02_FULL_42_58]OGD96877.1 MAG: phosphopyruvate hydratase [Candidatus Curtissbacteria bacterium RIFCSPHIGHO2_12_FULL_42_33]OGD98941.1 MAG: phosphopyruvate hydratase [Candidatus Curtissbacteria bacterium RIFCSPLOWO2_01_FULL_42_50]OGE03485.1 MAG: phosphopyruvate hydratase [Candidatus Curtissbacteria bacterium 
MATIKKIIGREILDSRGYPTVETIVQLSDGAVGVFSSPSGSSVGKHEAKEIRDMDPKRFEGLGVLNGLKNIHTILSPKLLGQEAGDQEKIDQTMIELDGTDDKSKIGANIILSLSGAITKAQSQSLKMPPYQYIAKLLGSNFHEFIIPTPMFNILNGGKHGDGNLNFQEFMIVPPKAGSYSKNLKLGVEVYYSLKETLKIHNALTLVGDEGGYAPTLYSNLDAMKILEEAVTKAGYKIGLDAFFSLDIAASNIKQGSSYKISDKPVPLSAVDFSDFYISLNEQYHLLSLEDPFDQDDWEDWQHLTEKLGKETLIVGDDLIATNIERLNKAVSQKAATAVVIKPNQAGTISETLKVVKAAKAASFKIIVSHRSGETNDDFIADFAVGVGADYTKLGAPARGERVAKYNRLLEIEHELS